MQSASGQGTCYHTFIGVTKVNKRAIMGGPECSPEFLALEELLSVCHYETLADW